ncbi:respiratory nitrate reductase subunit gamma [Bradyrhizobium sp.]|uniref:respiratory nitrate reductase subunit gamma n=1 Tax=Bradyrhizobium sp. TaxID=376 RepID=UPI0023975EE3|nr:respiratory nitrate reductase subunit gamma [Bradyrhizobium sp.]MDE2375749.1 respiratory nitrate reductase subunit gamma [Bradyrhizobium sp.]
MLTSVFAVMLYMATLVMAAGLGHRIWLYATTPAPLKIPTMPAPTTRGGVVLRMLSEVVVFRSLFKANKWIWLFGWVFHAALALVVMRHLRYFLQPVPEAIVLIQPFGVLAGIAMVAALVALWARRLLVPRIRYISSPSDHLMLVLLLAIGASGLAMKFWAHTDIVAAKAFCLGLVYLDWQPLPADPALLVHLTLVAVLMLIFPFSKLLHAPGVFFSPSRNQADDSRERRHVPPVRLEAVPR